jgi:hypothetical protein
MRVHFIIFFCVREAHQIRVSKRNVLWRSLDLRKRMRFLLRRKSPSRPRSIHFRGFTITLRHTTLGRTPMDEWSARRSTQQMQQIDIHAPGGIRSHNPSMPAATDTRHRMRGRWDRQKVKILRKITGEETLQLTLILLEWWKRGGTNWCSLYFVLLVKSTNKDLWLGKLRARFHFREDDIDGRIILKCVWVKWGVIIA